MTSIPEDFRGAPHIIMTLSQVAGGNHFDVGCILGSDSGTDGEASGYLGLTVSFFGSKGVG